MDRTEQYFKCVLVHSLVLRRKVGETWSGGVGWGWVGVDGDNQFVCVEVLSFVFQESPMFTSRVLFASHAQTQT